MAIALLPRRGAAAVVALGVVLEATALVRPIADRLEAQPALHDAQHGSLFVGAVLIGLGLRDLVSRVDDERPAPPPRA